MQIDPPPFWWTRLACHVAFGLLGREIPERRVDPPPVVVALDIGEEIAVRLVPGRPALLVNEFDLQRVEEDLHRRIVVAVSLPAHGRAQPSLRERLPIRANHVLRARWE